jgi:hypothetical protein
MSWEKMETHPSNSIVQINIEKEMLSYVLEQNPSWQKISWTDLSAGRELATKVKPDGVWRYGEGVIIIAECYARIGKLKPGHRRKIATDVLKLISLRDEFDKHNPPRLLLVVPEQLGIQLEDNDWLSMVIHNEVELIKVPLSDQQCQKLLEAASRQAQGQAHSAKSD